ncbi:(2Fe-2S)-binding protein [Rhodococcus jostii]|uniref:Carbon-monoxide dehydrogenase small subunit n=1 Tax=Rhodococcus jostii TaxID=132919 RepID=A0A1H4IS34_RHOJO|nr:(2Fe-2S)-binding protein [Rhodococcus jostii]SEB36870.1 carbon-monoxide dehydrogenase small subunit [Rhodococcus jostii]
MAIKVYDGDVAVRVTVNGVKRSGIAEPRTLLSDFIRHELDLTGTHVGCEHGVCGACTVRIDGQLVRSCITFAVQVDGAEIETVEGMADGAQLHPIQEAFRDEHGLQCGFCTPAMLLTTQALLEEDPDPSEGVIRDYISGNVCRCTGYQGIVNSVQNAARRCGDAAATCAVRNEVSE